MNSYSRSIWSYRGHVIYYKVCDTPGRRRAYHIDEHKTGPPRSRKTSVNAFTLNAHFISGIITRDQTISQGNFDRCAVKTFANKCTAKFKQI